MLLNDKSLCYVGELNPCSTGSITLTSFEADSFVKVNQTFGI